MEHNKSEFAISVDHSMLLMIDAFALLDWPYMMYRKLVTSFKNKKCNQDNWSNHYYDNCIEVSEPKWQDGMPVHNLQWSPLSKTYYRYAEFFLPRGIHIGKCFGVVITATDDMVIAGNENGMRTYSIAGECKQAEETWKRTQIGTVLVKSGLIALIDPSFLNVISVSHRKSESAQRNAFDAQVKEYVHQYQELLNNAQSSSEPVTTFQPPLLGMERNALFIRVGDKTEKSVYCPVYADFLKIGDEPPYYVDGTSDRIKMNTKLSNICIHLPI